MQQLAPLFIHIHHGQLREAMSYTPCPTAVCVFEIAEHVFWGGVWSVLQNHDDGS